MVRISIRCVVSEGLIYRSHPRGKRRQLVGQSGLSGNTTRTSRVMTRSDPRVLPAFRHDPTLPTRCTHNLELTRRLPSTRRSQCSGTPAPYLWGLLVGDSFCTQKKVKTTQQSNQKPTTFDKHVDRKSNST